MLNQINRDYARPAGREGRKAIVVWIVVWDARTDSAVTGISVLLQTSKCISSHRAFERAVSGETMQQRTDVLVIGGGPAGLAAAIAARRKGLDVTVADGARPPIDKACGEGLMPDTLTALRELGIVIQPGDGRIFRGMRFVDSANSVEANFLGASGFGMRRIMLHRKMAERAEECGVTLLWNTP